MSDKDVRNENLVEVLKRSSAIRKDWGLLFGSFIMQRSLNAAAGRRPFLWSWLVAAGVGAVTAWLQGKGWLSVLPWGR